MNGKPFAFFPTPYPDEILYSVLCRFHLRLGSPAAYRTNLILWGRLKGENLVTPQMLDRISGRIPPETGLTAQAFVERHTLYPYFKPFFQEERWREMYALLKDSSVPIRKIQLFSGILSVRSPRAPFLRYCQECREEDMGRFGEAYWHRVHQLPGVIFCPSHGTPVYDSAVPVPDAVTGFYPASVHACPGANGPMKYSDAAADQLVSFSEDSRWLLENGMQAGDSRQLHEAYGLQLRRHGLQGFTGRTMHQRLYGELCAFYEDEVLELLDARSSGICPWTQRLLQARDALVHPVYHLLLMGFLSGSAEAFFTDRCGETHPFGEAPWPCRNHVCEHFLEDVIESIELRCEKGRYKAVFACPHCGMVYRRKHPVPKEMQYEGAVYISDYGWKWKERLKQHLRGGSTTKAMMGDLHCDYYTIKKYGVQYGFLPSDQRLRKYPHPLGKPQEPGKPSPDGDERDWHRQRWLSAISENPHMSRKQLAGIERKSYLWLMENDPQWYDENTPAKKQTWVDWEKRDQEYCGMAARAIEELKAQPGRPRRITASLVRKQIGIGYLNMYMASGRLPETSAYLGRHAETWEEWRKRKVYWAVQEFKRSGTLPDVRDVMVKAGIAPKYFAPIEGYALECIKQFWGD